VDDVMCSEIAAESWCRRFADVGYGRKAKLKMVN
jgi:hypothetical protein